MTRCDPRKNDWMYMISIFMSSEVPFLEDVKERTIRTANHHENKSNLVFDVFFHFDENGFLKTVGQIHACKLIGAK